MIRVLLVFLFIFQVSFGSPVIYTTVKPLADIISSITGYKVDYLIPPEFSFHGYEFKASDLRKVYKSDLFVYIGSGEPNISGILEALPKNRQIKVINIKGLKLIGEDHHDHNHDHIHPALWLDPDNAAIIAQHIERKLEVLDPQKAPVYRKNLEKFKKDVEKIKKYGKEKFSKLKNKKFISYHYAWPYLTQAFGLEYAGVIEMGHGREPTPKHLLQIIKKIKKYKIRSIFAAKQFYNRKYTDLIKKNTGVKVVILDPFGINMNYIQMMRFNIDRVYNALQ